MHGFLGCLTEGQDEAAAPIQWMTDWIRIEPRKDAFEVRRPPFFFLGSNEPGSPGSPVASGQDGVVVSFAGFIAADQLADAEHAEPRTDSEVAAALLRAYRKGGADSLAGLNGRYVAAVWDPRTKSLALANDILGLKPVFLWSDSGTVLFSTSLWPIACHPRFKKVLDPRGVLDLLLFGHEQCERTLFEDVKILAPGSVALAREGRVTSRTVRGLQFSDARWDWSVNRAADGMYDLLKRSMARLVGDGSSVLLPLTGGFDSRTLLGLLLERPVALRAITQSAYGLYGDDARFARKLTRRAKVPHTRARLEPDFLARYRKRSVALGGGMYDIHTGRALSLLRAAGPGVSQVVSGILGRELATGFQISDTAFSTPEEHFALAFVMANRYYFSPDRARAMADGPSAKLVDDVVADNRRALVYDGARFFQRCYSYFLMVSRRRYISFQLCFLDQMTRIAAPFYDRDFVDFICSLPFAVLDEELAYRAMLARHFPTLAIVPNTNYGPLLVSGRGVITDFLDTKYRQFVRRPLLRLLVGTRSSSNHSEHFGWALRGPSRSVVDHLTERAELLQPHLKPAEVQEAGRRALRGDCSECMGILSLSALATTLEMIEDPREAIRAWAPESHESLPQKGGGSDGGNG